jgi:hypothetical protein
VRRHPGIRAPLVTGARGSPTGPGFASGRGRRREIRGGAGQPLRSWATKVQELLDLDALFELDLDALVLTPRPPGRGPRPARTRPWCSDAPREADGREHRRAGTVRPTRCSSRSSSASRSSGPNPARAGRGSQRRSPRGRGHLLAALRRRGRGDATPASRDRGPPSRLPGPASTPLLDGQLDPCAHQAVYFQAHPEANDTSTIRQCVPFREKYRRGFDDYGSGLDRLTLRVPPFHSSSHGVKTSRSTRP